MKKSVWIALAAMMVISLWMLSGRLADREELGTQVNAMAAESMTVSVMPSIAQRIQREIIVQGRLEAFRKVDLRAETAGSVQELAVEKGEAVVEGKVLLKLREKDRQAQIAKANADIASKRLVVEAMKRLRTQGLQSETNLKQAQADLAAAEAEKRRLKLDLSDTEIRAPFDGILESRDVELGSYVEIGDTVAQIVDVTRLKAVAYVNQRNISRLTMQQPVSIRMLDGREAEAMISYIAKDADTETRSFRIEAEFENPDAVFVAGVSAELRIIVGDTLAHFFSPAVLVLDESGQLGVKSLTNDHRVTFNPVERVKAENAGIWVTGLPDQITIIDRGQGFVLPGEKVIPVEASRQGL